MSVKVNTFATMTGTRGYPREYYASAPEEFRDVVPARGNSERPAFFKRSRKIPFNERMGDFLEMTADGSGNVAQRPLAGEHGQAVHRRPDGVLDPWPAARAEHPRVG
jgi:hypothetical protein